MKSQARSDVEKLVPDVVDPWLRGVSGIPVGRGRIFVVSSRSDRRSCARPVGYQDADYCSGPIEYARVGQGSPVLVLHGASGGWDQGLACARDLVGHGFQVIAPSRFGYLRTRLPADASAEAEADTWADLLDALHIPRLPVIAVSAGAAPAVQLALRHPPACRAWCCWLRAPAACIRAGPALLTLRVGGAVSLRADNVAAHAARTAIHVPLGRHPILSDPIIDA